MSASVTTTGYPPYKNQRKRSGITGKNSGKKSSEGTASQHRRGRETAPGVSPWRPERRNHPPEKANGGKKKANTDRGKETGR